MYLTNLSTLEVGIFSRPQAGWRDSTQEEIDADLLDKAKLAKIEVLGNAKTAFCGTGLLYDGNTFCLSDTSTNNIVLKENNTNFNSDNISAYTSGVNCYVLPQNHGIKVYVGQTIHISGFDEAANNGAKTVDFLEDIYLNIVEALTDEAVGDDICICSTDRYKYYDTSEVQVDFSDCAAWNGFFAAMMEEKDRIMRYYCSKKAEINAATDMETLDAITIDFSA